MVRCSRGNALGTLGICLLALVVCLLGGALIATDAHADEATPTPSPSPTVVRELIDQRTEYSQSFLLSDDSCQTRYFTSPVFARDDAGVWQPVNPAFLPVGGGACETASAPLDVTVANEAPGRAPVTVEADGLVVSLDLVGRAEDGSLVLGDTALYPDVASATDVTYTATGDALRELITLQSAAAPNVFTYRISHAGMALAKDAAGEWALFAPGASEPTFVIGPLCVFDSATGASGQGAFCEGATMTVVPGEGSSTITYSVPRSWLSDPARVWPVKIDPDLFSRNPTDVYLSSANPGTAEGSADPQNLFCGKVTSSNNCRTLIEFPQVSSIPAGAHIHSAELDVRQYSGPANTKTPHVYYLNNQSSLWGENATWNNTTLDSTEISDHITQAPNGDSTWLKVDCTDIVQMWHDGWPDNKGFQIRQTDAEGTGYGRKFRSGEYSDANYRPSLTVNYEFPGASISWDRGTSAYRVGDTMTVNVDLTNVADLSQVRSVRIGLNRTDGDPNRHRGLFAFFPGSFYGDANWVQFAAGSKFYWYNSPDAQGSDHITPLFDQCTYFTTANPNRVTFVFKLNDVASGSGSWYSDFGDVQGNTIDTIVDLKSGSLAGWSSDWVRNATNIDVQPTAPVHASQGLNSFAGNAVSVDLDQQLPRLAATDLTIASWGPVAEVSRTYTDDPSPWRPFLTALPGWRFDFERCLTSPSHGGPSAGDNFVYYYDEAGDRYVFLKRANGAYAYIAPNGFSAVLAQSGSSWTLTTDGGLVSTFNSSGKLASTSDRNSQTVTYGYTGSQLTSITAANGQAISLAYSSGLLSSATYATSAGSRQVGYSPTLDRPMVGHVTRYVGQSMQQTTDYAYVTFTGSDEVTHYLVSGVTAQNWPTSGSSATEQLTYSSGQLSDIYLPGYDAVSRPDAHVGFGYDTSQTAVGNATTATLSQYGASGGIAAQNLLTWRQASSRLTQAKAYAGTSQSGTLNTTTSIGWNGTYNVSQTQVVPASGPTTTTTYTYETDPSLAVYGKAVSQKDAANNVTTYAYQYTSKDPTGQLTKETTPNGTTTWNGYDACGNLTSVTKTFSGSSDKARTEYAYNANGLMTSEKKLISGTVTQNADGTFTVTNGVWAEIDYSNFAPNGEPQTTVAKAVKLTHNGAAQDLTKSAVYNAFGNLTSDSDWGGRTTETATYNVAGRKLTSTDAAGVVTNYFYDNAGNTTQTYQTAAGTGVKANWKATTYDANGNALTVTTYLSDGSGNPTTQSVVTNTYDGAGRQLTSSDSTVGGQPEKWVYDANGNEISHWAMGVLNYTDAYRSTRTSYDGEGNQTGQSDPGNSVAPGPVGVSQNDPTVVGGTRTHYDSLGQVDYEISADKSKVTYVFDGDGNTTSEASTATGTTTSVCGIGDRQTSQTKQSGFTTSSAYDMLGQVIGATGASQSQTQTEYNTLGWVLQTVDANGVTTLKTYDTHGNVTDETIGAAGTTHSTHDAANRLLAQTDPNGYVLTNTYDAFGNLDEGKHQDWNAATLKDVVTNYDSLGRATSESESVSGRSHTWTYPVNAPSATQETISYDAAPLTSTQINCNARGMETSRATTIAGGVTLTRSVADSLSGRDQADRWTSASLQLSGFNALTLGRSFDDAGRITAQSGAGFSSAGSYAYNATSGLKSNQTLPLVLGGTVSDSYTYSADGRLHTWGTATYSFGAAGNLTSDGATIFNYDAASNRLTSSVSGGATTVYGWDAQDAWRTSQGPTGTPNQIQYTYVKSGASTSNGRMTRYQNSATSTDASYTYDASGQRTRSVAAVGSTTTTTDFTYDGLDLLKLSGTQGSSTWRIDYLYDEDGAVYGGVYRSPTTSTSPIYFTMITNDHGDVLDLLDANGAAFASYRYDPWGSPLAAGTTTASTGLITSALAGQIASRQVLRYASYAYDSESGLYYCSARYYDPATRQWTTGDPAKADGEESAYQYCGGDPISRTDPTGLKYTKHTAKYQVQWKSAGVTIWQYTLHAKWWSNGRYLQNGSTTFWASDKYINWFCATLGVYADYDWEDCGVAASRNGHDFEWDGTSKATLHFAQAIKVFNIPIGAWHTTATIQIWPKPNIVTGSSKDYKWSVIGYKT